LSSIHVPGKNTVSSSKICLVVLANYIANTTRDQPMHLYMRILTVSHKKLQQNPTDLHAEQCTGMSEMMVHVTLCLLEVS